MSIFKLDGLAFELVHTEQGGANARSVGTSLEMRAQTTQFNMQTYEVFYDNWMPVGDQQQQNKIGRLGVLIAEDGDMHFDNDFDEYVPVDGISASGGSFAVNGEHLAYMSHAAGARSVVYGHACAYDQYYTDRGETSTGDFCSSCDYNADSVWSGSLISLGVQDTVCLTCTELQQQLDFLGDTAAFIYGKACPEAAACTTAVIEPFSENKLAFSLA